MSEYKAYKCDLCGKAPLEDKFPVITIIVRTRSANYRLNDGDLCGECLQQIFELLAPLEETVEAEVAPTLHKTVSI